MAIKFNQFTTGDVSNTGSADYLVGYDSTQDGVANGERKWTVATIANAVSGVMTPQLNNAFFNSTDVIPVAKGGTERTTGFAGLTALAGTVPPTINTYLKVNGSNNGLTYDVIDLNSGDVTGVLPVSKGGTGGSTGGATTAKAWVNFNGTLSTPITPRAQYNVSSVTKSGTGAYTINFATAMADANYVFVSGAMNRQNSGNSTGDVTGILVAATNTASLKTTTQLSIGYMGGGSAYDGSEIHVAIFGN